MVTSDEISQRLRDKRDGNSSNGYLVCNSCGGYYELQPGESWTDFDTECECGGQLVHSATNSLVSSDSSLAEEEFERKRFQLKIIIAYIAFFLFWPISFILAIYLVTRDNQRAKFHETIDYSFYNTGSNHCYLGTSYLQVIFQWT